VKQMRNALTVPRRRAIVAFIMTTSTNTAQVPALNLAILSVGGCLKASLSPRAIHLTAARRRFFMPQF